MRYKVVLTDLRSSEDATLCYLPDRLEAEGVARELTATNPGKQFAVVADENGGAEAPGLGQDEVDEAPR